MDQRDLFHTAGAAVAGLLAAYGGFLLKIQPPDQAMPAYAVGFASLLGSIVYLFIILISKSLPTKFARGILLVLTAISLLGLITSGIVYQNTFGKSTFLYPDGTGQYIRLVHGDQLTPGAHHVKDKDPGISDEELLEGFGGVKYMARVWTPDSTLQQQRRLSWGYILLVVSICATVFSLLKVIQEFN